MKSFNRYLKENRQQSGVVVTWGRYNPPTTGHELMFNTAAAIANSQGSTLRIMASRTNDAENNPLIYEKKLDYLRAIFPRYKSYISETATNDISVELSLLAETYTHLTVVVGSDRVSDFQNLLDRINERYIGFESYTVVSAGKRDPDLDDTSGMSASKMRSFVETGDFNSFVAGLPSKTDTAIARSLFEDVRTGMGIKDKYIPIALTRTPEREEFFSGNMLSVGDRVLVKSNERHGTVERIGSNFIVVRHDDDDSTKRVWPKDVKRNG